MHLGKSLSLLLLIGTASATHYGQQEQSVIDYITPLAGENKLTLVPLNNTARTGAVPIEKEETVIGLGNRFANEFYANISHDGELGSCWSCAVTLKKEAPCIVKAIKDRNPADLLRCGIRKADICKCADCLPPGSIRDYVEKWCHSKEEGEVQDLYKYGEFYHLADVDLNLQAVLGTAKTYHLEQAAASGCFSGRRCGNCPCCIGICVWDHGVETCIGHCAM